MAGAAMELTLDGLPGAKRTLDILIEKGRDTSELMDRIGLAMESSTVQRFEDELAPDGSRWTPSRRVQLTSVPKKGAGVGPIRASGKTLTASARLKQSITYNAHPASVEWGTNVKYARIHNEGGLIRAKNGGRLHFQLPGIGWVSPREVVMPKRQFIGLSDEDEEEIPALTEEWLAEGIEL